MRYLVFTWLLLLPAIADAQVMPPTAQPIEMSRGQVQSAGLNDLVAYLTSHGVGRRLFGDPRNHFDVETVRAMALREFDLEHRQ